MVEGSKMEPLRLEVGTCEALQCEVLSPAGSNVAAPRRSQGGLAEW